MDGLMIELNDPRWRAVLDRDVTQDGAFVYAVGTTGIYCRPSCASRKPKPENVRFYPDPESARRAGYRPCKRCRPDQVTGIDVRLATVAELCRRIEAAAADGLQTLDMLAKQAGYSPSHLQRLFTDIVGVSPRAYADRFRMAAAKAELKAGAGAAEAAYGAGFGSASRLYERSNAELGMTPASYAKGGAGAEIRHAFAATALGRLLVGSTTRGLCFVAIGDSDEELLAELHDEFPAARHVSDETGLSDYLAAAAGTLSGRRAREDLPLDIQATAFQARVWRGLTRIPAGETRTYKELAGMIGKPNAARAVGLACAKNPVSLVAPCHRVVGADGALTGYRWGVARKRILLARERMEPDGD